MDAGCGMRTMGRMPLLNVHIVLTLISLRNGEFKYIRKIPPVKRKSGDRMRIY